MSGVETESGASAGARAAVAGAVAASGSALACGACCILPFALPAAALGFSGGVIAWFARLQGWMTWVAVAAVVASWAWIGWESLTRRKRPARSTILAMTIAAAMLAGAVAWPHFEDPIRELMGA